ncbi:MAG: hypothetical protein Ct9H300mP18_09700 [Candidatus Neomarinimicrobiota bacterium]|nr:MAG: hypothetical protein Ct9H300mP18_09700 [Candidatus Neomarinimicrobiota bacterium]
MPGQKCLLHIFQLKNQKLSEEVWGDDVARISSDSTKLYYGLIDWIWGMNGKKEFPQ